MAASLGELGRAGSVSFDLATEDHRCATLEARLVHGAPTDQTVDHPVLAVCTLTRGSRDRLQSLRAPHGLTKAEARVAVQIAEGQGPMEIAASTGQSITTVRTHLASVRRKLGVRRQAQVAARELGL